MEPSNTVYPHTIITPTVQEWEEESLHLPPLEGGNNQ